MVVPLRSVGATQHRAPDWSQIVGHSDRNDVDAKLELLSAQSWPAMELAWSNLILTIEFEVLSKSFCALDRFDRSGFASPVN